MTTRTIKVSFPARLRRAFQYKMLKRMLVLTAGKIKFLPIASYIRLMLHITNLYRTGYHRMEVVAHAMKPGQIDPRYLALDHLYGRGIGAMVRTRVYNQKAGQHTRRPLPIPAEYLSTALSCLLSSGCHKNHCPQYVPFDLHEKETQCRYPSKH